MNPYAAFLLPLFFFLLSLTHRAASATPPTSLQSPPSLILASDALGSRGYTIFSTLLIALSTATSNFSGTLFAPPDFAFSAASSFLHRRRRTPPRPSTFLLFYHTVQAPLVLPWIDLSTGDDGTELPSFYDSNCLYLYKNPFSGEVYISPYPLNNPLEAVTIRQPDIYVDDHLAVHGIDGVLNPAYATKCAIGRQIVPSPASSPRPSNRSFVDSAIRMLKMKGGYNVVATAMAVRKPELRKLNSFTVFAVPDQNLFLNPDGFHFDFRHHVLPMQYRISDLATVLEGMQLVTLSPYKVVRVCNARDGVIRINGVTAGDVEIYVSKRIAIISVATSMDDSVDIPCRYPVTADEYSDNNPSPISPISAPAVSPSGNVSEAPSPAPVNSGENLPDSVLIDRAVSDYDASNLGNTTALKAGEIPDNAPSPSPVSSPSPSPAEDGLIDKNCGLGAAVNPLQVEGGDVYCPSTIVRKLREMELGHVEASAPLDADSLAAQDSSQKFRMSDSVNIADDLFFYI